MEELLPTNAVCNSRSGRAEARDIVCADKILVGNKEEEDKDGAQHIGTGIGFGGRRGIIERGNKRRLAARSKVAVVKVIANEIANRSWRAVCGCG